LQISLVKYEHLSSSTKMLVYQGVFVVGFF